MQLKKARACHDSQAVVLKASGCPARRLTADLFREPQAMSDRIPTRTAAEKRVEPQVVDRRAGTKVIRLARGVPGLQGLGAGISRGT
jgi:hypothetical protein